MKKVLDIRKCRHLYDKWDTYFKKFAHINAIEIKDEPTMFVLNGITEEDIFAMKILGINLEEDCAFEASEIKKNGITTLVILFPGETTYRIFDVETTSHNSEDGE